MNDYPTVSIVTPSYNQGEFLSATIESVISQSGDFFLEYIIMDGGSTDNSVEIMKRYDSLLQRGEWNIACKGITFRWHSEKDKGQADAVNKGFAQADGEMFGWLNSDDTYLPGAVAKAVEFFMANPDTVMVYGNAWYTDRAGAITQKYRSEPFSLKRLAVRNIICQPSVLIRRESLQKVGELDTSLHTCLDYDLWIRLGKVFEKHIVFLDDYLATSRMYADNKTLSLRDLIYRETMLIAQKHFGYVPGVWIVHSILEVLQSSGMPFLSKARTLIGCRLPFLLYLLQPKTLLSVIWFLLTRLTKDRSVK
jgi:glycosyltransferase involved in cell wall biosynthesis